MSCSYFSQGKENLNYFIIINIPWKYECVLLLVIRNMITLPMMGRSRESLRTGNRGASQFESSGSTMDVMRSGRGTQWCVSRSLGLPVRGWLSSLHHRTMVIFITSGREWKGMTMRIGSASRFNAFPGSPRPELDPIYRTKECTRVLSIARKSGLFVRWAEDKYEVHKKLLSAFFFSISRKVIS